MDELLALLERYMPGCRRHVQGAHDWRVDELEEVFGHPLPGFYRNFAQMMGEGGGPLLAHVRSYEPLHVSDIYQLTPQEELPPRRFLFVFGDSSLDAQHYWLDLESPSGEGDCQVVRIPFGKDAWRTHLFRSHESLREMLFDWAMRFVYLPTFSHHARYVSRGSDVDSQKTEDVENIARIFERLGFVRLLYPRRCLLFERDDAGIELYRPPGDAGFSFQVGMRDPHKLRRFQEAVEDTQSVKKW